MNGFDPKISYRVRDLRERCGYTREDLAEQVALSVKTLENFENAQCNLKLVNFAKICKELHASSDYILFGNQDLVGQAAAFCSQMSLEQQFESVRILIDLLQNPNQHKFLYRALS